MEAYCIHNTREMFSWPDTEMSFMDRVPRVPGILHIPTKAVGAIPIHRTWGTHSTLRVECM